MEESDPYRTNIHLRLRGVFDIVVDPERINPEFPWCQGIRTHGFVVSGLDPRLVCELLVGGVQYDRSLSGCEKA